MTGSDTAPGRIHLTTQDPWDGKPETAPVNTRRLLIAAYVVLACGLVIVGIIAGVEFAGAGAAVLSGAHDGVDHLIQILVSSK